MPSNPDARAFEERLGDERVIKPQLGHAIDTIDDLETRCRDSGGGDDSLGHRLVERYRQCQRIAVRRRDAQHLEDAWHVRFARPRAEPFGHVEDKIRWVSGHPLDELSAAPK